MEAGRISPGFFFSCASGFVIALVGAADCSLAGASASEVQAEEYFRARCAEIAIEADRSGAMRVFGSDDWLFLASELSHIGTGQFWGENAVAASRTAKPEQADPLPAILDFNEQLRARGIELLVAPVPAKAVVYPEHVPGAVRGGAVAAVPLRMDIGEQAFFGVLETNGVGVLDLTPLFLANRNSERGPLYCRQDSHWSGVGCVLAGEAIAKHVTSRPWYKPGSDIRPAAEWTRITIAGDLRSELSDEVLPREELRIRKVGVPSESGLRPIPTDEASPVILLGDSHNLVFHGGGDMHASQAGLADQLAFELGFPVDLLGVRGSGATPARINLLRRAQKDPGYWTKKRIVVWCFSVREFTQSDGWRRVPIAP